MDQQLRCLQCQHAGGHIKAGINASGSQRYLCKPCRHRYTPELRPIGYGDERHRQALQLYVDGLNFRRIGRILGGDHQTVANWAAAHARTLPDAPPLPATTAREPPPVCELDELYTFEGGK